VLTARWAAVQTQAVAGGALLGGDLEGALNRIGIPAYVIDPTGVIRWINDAGRSYVGDVVGRQFTSLVAPEETNHVRHVFARKIVGRASVTDFESVIVQQGGERLGVQISSVPLLSGERVVGVFGQIHGIDEQPIQLPEYTLTPRQTEVLRLLEHGYSTDEIAAELHLSRETVRNHVRGLLRSLGVKSRLEAVAVAHGDLVR
jgi:PAS domain S-box-containing protein